MSNILDRIVATKRDEVRQAKQRTPIASLGALLDKLPSCCDFLGALQGFDSIRLIAEVKKASPSKGVIRSDFDPVAIAKSYERGGAACLSVLTDEVYFQGSLDYLTAVKQSVRLPILRKDFIIDEYQLVEARVAGADAVLLIAECLDEVTLNQLYRKTRELGMHALIELYEPENLSKVLATGCPLIGVNNRDLRSFEVDLHHTLRLRKSIPADRCLVGESGIFTAADAKLLYDGGVQAVLVGESLMRQDDIEEAAKKLLAIGSLR
jgi:indole-3-glycerol phosphate synthase